jgi:hypothetical protein
MVIIKILIDMIFKMENLVVKNKNGNQKKAGNNITKIKKKNNDKKI